MSQPLNPKSSVAFSQLTTMSAMGVHQLAEMERLRFDKIERLLASGVSVWVLDDNDSPFGNAGTNCRWCGAFYSHGREYCSADCCRAGREAEKRNIAGERAAMKAAKAKSKAKKNR